MAVKTTPSPATANRWRGYRQEVLAAAIGITATVESCLAATDARSSVVGIFLIVLVGAPMATGALIQARKSLQLTSRSLTIGILASLPGVFAAALPTWRDSNGFGFLVLLNIHYMGMLGFLACWAIRTFCGALQRRFPKCRNAALRQFPGAPHRI